jgi:hypothetical protein
MPQLQEGRNFSFNKTNLVTFMQAKSNHDSMEHLMNLAAECAQWHLRQNGTFQHAFLFYKDSRVGVAWTGPHESVAPIEDFVESIRHFAIANNITTGVFVERIENVRVSSPEKCPFSPASSEYVLITWQSQTEHLTLAFPVRRTIDGTFSHLGQFLRANPLHWVPNIIPQQEPRETERLASARMLQNWKLLVEFQRNEPGGEGPMKTLIMNDSRVMGNKVPGDELDEIFRQIVAHGGQSILTSRDTPIEVDYQAVDGAARFRYYSNHGYYLEALVLSTGRGRQCWTDFHSCCEEAMSCGKATGTNPASAVPDDGAWNCVILYRASDQLAEEDLNELFGFHCRLAQVCLRQIDKTPAAPE